MLNQLQNLTQRVGGSHTLIDQWLESRKNLLVTYYRLVGIKPNKEKNIPLDETALNDFGHHLVDYLSTCHFHLYNKIITQEEGASSPNLAIGVRLHPLLQSNTAEIMTFYDNYVERGVSEDNLQQLNQDLSTIGELLESRFTLEDKLIQAAMKSWLNHQTANDATK